MRYLAWAVVVTVAVVAAGPAAAADVEFKPIDTKRLVVQPSKAVAALTAATIDMAGKTAASGIERNGFVKTINNLLRKPTPTTVQAGPSPLPAPHLFQSTQYKSYNTPVLPTVMPARR
jgi:hypothetical protein